MLGQAPARIFCRISDSDRADLPAQVWQDGAMNLHIALLRAVNGGGRAAPSAALRAQFGELGHGEVRTLLQSGNVVFEAEPEPGLERRLEAGF